jgi:hypothetical protein
VRKTLESEGEVNSEEGLKVCKRLESEDEMIPDLMRRISPILSVRFCSEIMASRSATEIVKRDVGSYLMLCLSA